MGLPSYNNPPRLFMKEGGSNFVRLPVVLEAKYLLRIGLRTRSANVSVITAPRRKKVGRRPSQSGDGSWSGDGFEREFIERLIAQKASTA